MPGVFVQTATSPGPSQNQKAPAAQLFLVGMTERGSTLTPTVVGSIPAYRQAMGNRVPYGFVDDQVNMYFNEGGTQAVVARVVGPGASTGSLTLNDRAGSPQPTVQLSAVSPGSWSAQLTVTVADEPVANTFSVTLFLNGQQVERYGNLASPAAMAAAMAKSAYVVPSNLSSATAAPANNPAAVSAVALAAGSDDAGSVTASTCTAALNQFALEFGTGLVAIPGFSASQVGAALKSHCSTFRREGAMAPVAGDSPAAAKSDAAAFRGSTGSEFVGYFYPWVLISDGNGGTRSVSPEGYVAGVRARAHTTVGPWQAPAGEIAVAKSVLGLEPTATTDAATAIDLDNNNVSCIRVVQNTVRLYGYRSLSTDTVNFQFLTDAGMQDYLVNQIQALMEPYVFGNIDGAGIFFNRMKQDVIGFLDTIRQQGGLFAASNPDGSLSDPGYTVDVGPTVNTPASIAQGVVNVNVGYRKSGTAAMVNVLITKTAIGVAL